MTTALTPVPTAPGATTSIPAPGEGVTSAAMALFVQPIINSVAWLQSKIPGANPSGALLDLAYTPEQAFALISGSTDWGFSETLGKDRGFCVQNVVSTHTDDVRVPLNGRLVQGMVMRAMAVDFVGKNGHGALPATMPQIVLAKFARSIGTGYSALVNSPGPTITVIDSKTDTSVNVAAYEVLHTIAKTLTTPETVDLTAFDYYLYVVGEYSTNALQHSAFFNARISVSQ